MRSNNRGQNSKSSIPSAASSGPKNPDSASPSRRQTAEREQHQKYSKSLHLCTQPSFLAKKNQGGAQRRSDKDRIITEIAARSRRYKVATRFVWTIVIQQSRHSTDLSRELFPRLLRSRKSAESGSDGTCR